MITDLGIRAKDRLVKLADQVAGLHPNPEIRSEFTIRDVLENHENLILNLRRHIKRGGKYIYYLSVIGNSNLSDLRRSFSETRGGDSGRAYARLNPHESSCLYVGSSSDLLKRMKEHLGYGAKATFALNLAWWAGDFPDLGLSLGFSQLPETTTVDAMQALEDTLWDELRPMFGRRGSK
ncbi:MAG TPA: hypothetical protein V6D26_23560 [Stenomitos sp.]